MKVKLIIMCHSPQPYFPWLTRMNFDENIQVTLNLPIQRSCDIPKERNQKYDTTPMAMERPNHCEKLATNPR